MHLFKEPEKESVVEEFTRDKNFTEVKRKNSKENFL